MFSLLGATLNNFTWQSCRDSETKKAIKAVIILSVAFSDYQCIILRFLSVSPLTTYIEKI